MLTGGLGAFLVLTTIISTLAVALGGGLGFEPISWVIAFVGGPALLLGTIITFKSTKGRSNKLEPINAAFMYGLIYGPIIVLAILGPFMAYDQLTNPYALGRLDLERVITGLVILFMGAGFLGLPTGFLVGGIVARLVRFGCSGLRAHDSVERTELVCGRWLTLVAAACSIALTLAHIAIGGVRAPSTELGGLIPCGAALSFALLCLVAYWRAQRRLEDRRRWVSMVRDGRVPGWVLLPLDESNADTVAGLRPFIAADRPPSNASLLAKTIRGAERGAYRTGDRWLPVAVVGEPESSTRA